MRFSKPFLLMFFLGFCFIGTRHVFGQEAEITEIKAQREASNKALKNFDEELNNTFLTEDVLITTGAGTLLSEKRNS